MAGVVLERVVDRVGNVVAANDLSVAVKDREVLVLMGPPGGRTSRPSG